jgi:chromosome segregation ATPase
MEMQEKKSSHAGYKLTIMILVTALACVTFWYVRESRILEEVNQQISDDRDEILDKLNDMLIEYNDIKTSNKAMKLELETEKAKIQTLQQKLRSAQQMHYAEIRQYEKETSTLRDIMRSYIRQIDSLNTLSQRLLAENKEVKYDLQNTRVENKKLNIEKQNLSSQIEKGSMLRVRSIEASGLNSRDKDTYSASRSKKLRACFTINENTIAKAGNRYAYVRLIGPDNQLLTNEASDGAFETRTEELLAYSAKREVDYQNQDLEACIFFDAKNMKLSKGAYTVEVYIDGSLSGSGQFLLK